MLDLAQPVRTVEGVELAADEEPLTFYLLPPPPRVAVVDGHPQLELLRFIRNGELTGGHLRLAVELAHPAAVLRRAVTALADTLSADADRIALRPCPVESASAELLFVGREATGDGGESGIVRRGYGVTAAQSIAPFTAAFSISLTADGVRLVESAMRSGAAPIGITYRLQVEGLWPAQRILVRIDWRRAYDHFSTHLRDGALITTTDVQRITEALIEESVIRIQAVQGVVPEPGEPPVDISPVITWVQRELVEKFCEPVLPLRREPARASLGTLGEIVGVGTSFAGKILRQTEYATADIDLQRARVVTRTLSVQRPLVDLLGDAEPDRHITDADPSHPFFERMNLTVRSSRPLGDVHAKEMVLRFGYGTFTEDGRLTADAPEARFETWANAAADRTWTLRPELEFMHDSPLDPGVRVPALPQSGQGRELTVDVDAVWGLRRVEVSAPVDPRVLITRATLTRRRDAEPPAEQVLTFVAATSPQIAWFRDWRPSDRLEVAVEYLLTDNRRISHAPVPVDTSIVRLAPPFPGTMTVQLVSDDDWTDLERVIVAVQKEAEMPAGTFEFKRPTTMVAVNLDLPDPTRRSFRYRMTRSWSSGVVEEDPWVETDVPVVLVGRAAATKLVVDVRPIGPELPEAGVRLIEVELLYIDTEHQIRATENAVIGALADRFRWEVAIKDPSRRRYEYRVKVHRLSGPSTVGPWTFSTERLLPIPVTAA